MFCEYRGSLLGEEARACFGGIVNRDGARVGESSSAAGKLDRLGKDIRSHEDGLYDG